MKPSTKIFLNLTAAYVAGVVICSIAPGFLWLQLLGASLAIPYLIVTLKNALE